MNASHPTRTVNKKRIRKAVGFPGIQSSFQHELMKIQRDTQEETLMQVSEELHDNIGQLLALTKVYLGIAERTLPDPQHILKTANSTLSKATRDLRRGVPRRRGRCAFSRLLFWLGRGMA